MIGKKGILKDIGSTPFEKPSYGTTFLNPLIIKKKNDSTRLVLDTRYLNTNTDQSSET